MRSESTKFRQGDGDSQIYWLSCCCNTLRAHDDIIPSASTRIPKLYIPWSAVVVVATSCLYSLVSHTWTLLLSHTTAEDTKSARAGWFICWLIPLLEWKQCLLTFPRVTYDEQQSFQKCLRNERRIFLDTWSYDGFFCCTLDVNIVIEEEFNCVE